MGMESIHGAQNVCHRVRCYGEVKLDQRRNISLAILKEDVLQIIGTNPEHA